MNKKKSKKIGRPSTVKKLTRISLSLSASEKKEFLRQGLACGSFSTSRYLRFLIDENRDKY